MDAPFAKSSASLVDLLRLGAGGQPDAPCLDVAGRTITYGMLLDRAANARAEIARRLGTHQPPVIAVLARDVAHLLAAELAAMSLGADVLLLDVRSPRDQLAKSLASVGDPPVVAYEPLDVPLTVIVLDDHAEPTPGAPTDALPPADRGGRLAFQSLRSAEGPVVLSRGAVLADATEFLSMTEFPAGGSWFNCLPAQSVNGQQTIAAMWLQGSCFATASFSTSSFWDDVARSGAHAVTVLGSMGRSLIHSTRRAPGCAKAALGGSFIVDPAPAFEATTGVTLLNTFGTPMVGLVSASTMAARRLGSVGRPVSGVAVRFVGDDGTTDPTGPGTIEVAKSQRAVGFVGADGTIEPSPSHDGYVQLVERGHLDDGYLVVTEWPGLLRRSGESISHQAIIQRLGHLEGVSALEVVDEGHDGEWQRYRLRATVRGGTTPDRKGIASACERLPRMMRPDEIEVVVLDEDDRGGVNE